MAPWTASTTSEYDGIYVGTARSSSWAGTTSSASGTYYADTYRRNDNTNIVAVLELRIPKFIDIAKLLKSIDSQELTAVFRLTGEDGHEQRLMLYIFGNKDYFSLYLDNLSTQLRHIQTWGTFM